MKYPTQLSRIAIIIASVFSASVSANGAWVEAREAYETGYDRHELAFRGGYDFASSAGIMLTNAYDTGKYDQLKHSFNELEGWYPLYSFENFTLMGGAIVNENSDGSGGAAYFDFRYVVDPALSFVLRTRYNYRNYDSINLHNNMQPNDTGEFHLGMNYVINPDWTYYLEPTYVQQVNDFHSANNRDHHWEINNVITYTGFINWRPYVEIGYMDRVTAEHEDNYRIRLGLRYNF
ncbi:TPA: porin OmpL [Klebsiella pneumoniae]|nr:porin OmpL [Klebsiella pneumoniae]